MEKYSYFVIDEHNPITGKCCAYALRVANCYNLLGYFQPHKDAEIISINSCDTYKAAQKTAAAWNNAYIEKGVYLFA